MNKKMLYNMFTFNIMCLYYAIIKLNGMKTLLSDTTYVNIHTFIISILYFFLISGTYIRRRYTAVFPRVKHASVVARF